jgi:hypothetical protein
LQAQALATAHVHEDNLDEACRIAPTRSRWPTASRSRRTLHHMRRLRLDLEPWPRSAGGQALDEQLVAVGSAR